MDLFAADLITPFPDSGDLIYAADLLPHRQKLRPIRSNASGYLPCVLNTEFSDRSQSPSFQPQQQDPIGSGSGHAPIQSALDSGCSLDSEDDDNSCANTKELRHRKRRKKREKRLEDFVQNMASKVMEKQEQMHKQLLDLIENKERERIQKEEAWRQEEMKRIKKDEEARAQEMSRNLAIISMIENVLGQEGKIWQPAATSFKKDYEEAEMNLDIKTEVEANIGDDRWPRNEEQALITLRASMDHMFCVSGYKGTEWGEISKAMHAMGYNRSSMMCMQKWENMIWHYRWVKVMKEKGQEIQNNENFPFIDDLDILYRNESISLAKALSITPKIEEETQSET